MQRRKCAIVQSIIALVTLLFIGGGCSWHRTGMGWTVQSGWSLEFRRNPCSCGMAGQCTEQCAAQIPPGPNCAGASDTESEVINTDNPKFLEKPSNSPFARLLERHGRLGLCASCGRLTRFPGSGAEEQAIQPVIAKLHPVPTQPVFCPRQEAMQPASNDPGASQKAVETAASLKKPRPKATRPKEIPAPPGESEVDSSAAAVPRQLNVPREPWSWIFSTSPEKKAEPVVEAQVPPWPSERATRR